MLKQIIGFQSQNSQLAYNSRQNNGEHQESITYNEAKRYMPNFIRRVLETFLSFKFSSIPRRSGRTSGLNEFDENIQSMGKKKFEKENLKTKILNIRRITDPHSHGNAYITQENGYVSEGELRSLAKDAIDVITEMDKPYMMNFEKNFTAKKKE